MHADARECFTNSFGRLDFTSALATLTNSDFKDLKGRF